jgi:hypothetical protein
LSLERGFDIATNAILHKMEEIVQIIADIAFKRSKSRREEAGLQCPPPRCPPNPTAYGSVVEMSSFTQ